MRGISRIVAVAALVACGSSSNQRTSASDAGAGDDASAADAAPDAPSAPPIKIPGDAPYDAWSWIPFPESHCADESATGIGINPTMRSKRLLIFLDGGGLCYSDAHCTVLNTNYDSTKLADFAKGAGVTGVLNRNDPSNPFKDYGFVFVPYCTGDGHAGDNVMTYPMNGKYHHAGYTNYGLFLARIAATFRGADSVVIAGWSAGGLGASWNYYRTHEAFKPVPVQLVDDSGAWFRSPPFPADLLQQRATSWGLDKTAPPGCAACATATGQSGVVPYAATQFPDFRGSFIDSTNDSTIAALSGADPAVVAASIADIQPAWSSDRFKVFLVSGTQHGFLAKGPPSTYVTNGVTLADFLQKQLSGDPSWTNVVP